MSFRIFTCICKSYDVFFEAFFQNAMGLRKRRSDLAPLGVAILCTALFIPSRVFNFFKTSSGETVKTERSWLFELYKRPRAEICARMVAAMLVAMAVANEELGPSGIVI